MESNTAVSYKSLIYHVSRSSQEEEGGKQFHSFNT